MKCVVIVGSAGHTVSVEEAAWGASRAYALEEELEERQQHLEGHVEEERGQA